MSEDLIKYIDHPHPVTGVTNAKLGMWLFLATEIMLFGGLFSAYVILRSGAPATGPLAWPHAASVLNVPLATINTMVLIVSSVTMVMAWASLAQKKLGRSQFYLAMTFILAAVFLVIKYKEYADKFHHEHFPSTSNFYAVYFTMTGLHGLHILGGMFFILYYWLTASYYWNKNPDMLTGRIESLGLYWHFVDLVWIFLFPSLYLL